jgi:hypothetical protein
MPCGISCHAGDRAAWGGTGPHRREKTLSLFADSMEYLWTCPAQRRTAGCPSLERSPAAAPSQIWYPHNPRRPPPAPRAQPALNPAGLWRRQQRACLAGAEAHDDGRDYPGSHRHDPAEPARGVPHGRALLQAAAHPLPVETWKPGAGDSCTAVQRCCKLSAAASRCAALRCGLGVGGSVQANHCAATAVPSAMRFGGFSRRRA